MTIDARVIDTTDTPAASIDLPRTQHNIARMQHCMDALGMKLRPYMKTIRRLDIVRAQVAAGVQDIIVSMLKEAEAFFAAGIKDILYAVGIAATKLPHATALRKRGCDLKLVVDNAEAAHVVVGYARAHGEHCEVWTKVDTDGHRFGITPEQNALLEIGRILKNGGIDVSDVMTHAGSGHDLSDRATLAALAEQERAGCMHAAQCSCEARVPCAAIGVGFTPTALATEYLGGATEVRVGVYVFFDLTIHNVGVCAMDEIALSMLTTVIGHQPDKGWVIVDAGWMAMSRGRGTAKQSHGFGYGQSCTLDGTLLEGLTLIGASQEYSILAVSDSSAHVDLLARFPVGAKPHVLPNHACATGVQFPEYQAVSSRGVVQAWARFHGW